ncbi:MAG: bifunctional 5,10-methylenetetrahydrofolate dehydrogenase/5,10-methenyltetrahydrofolate cyclohydrolase [Anaerolineae bacterium]|jgi:methylenetetrahydrofolate dehydrogenase (NADP+)/methenyltetrahydrofolate cyclohydrolase
MNSEPIISTEIKPQLVESFGRQTANALVTQGTLAYVSTDGSEEERFDALLRAVCTDARVVDAWGPEIAADRMDEWRRAYAGYLGRVRALEEKGEKIMTARILDGRAMAKELRQEVAAGVAAFEEEYGFAPTIAVVRAGSDPASVSYGKMIKKSFEGVGMNFALHTLPDTATTDDVVDVVAMLNADGNIQGIMVQEPLPRGIDDDEVKATILPRKDVDGVNPINAGRLAQASPVGRLSEVRDYFVPATPLGGLEMLLRADVDISGKQAVVVGRSNIVGRPMSFLLMQHNATVSMCHSRTQNLGEVTRQADILCTAVGVAHLITGDMVKPGAVVIDFGFNRLDDRWVGDVDFEDAKEVAGMITPVPGGTGSMTNMILCRNVLEAARRQAGGG